MKKNCRNVLLGVGLDCRDRHTRITRGKNFYLYGGSSRTHKILQEKAIKFNEHLDKKGKTIDDICKKEFCEIADKIGLRPFKEE